MLADFGVRPRVPIIVEAEMQLSKVLEEDNFSILTTTCGVSADSICRLELTIRLPDTWPYVEDFTDSSPENNIQPEIFRKAGHGKPVDIWAIGVITSDHLLAGYAGQHLISRYFLLCGYTPFDRDSQYEEMQAICNGDYKFEPVSDVPICGTQVVLAGEC